MVLRASSYLIVALLLVSKPSLAGLFDDEKAREQIDLLQKQTQAMEARIAGMEELLKSNALIEIYSQVEGFKTELGRLTGQIEVLTEENKLLRKQQKDFYLDLDNRLNQLSQEDQEIQELRRWVNLIHQPHCHPKLKRLRNPWVLWNAKLTRLAIIYSEKGII